MITVLWISKQSLTLQNQLDLPRDIAVISHPHSQFDILPNLATNWVAANTFRARTRVTMLSRWGMDFAIIIFEINKNRWECLIIWKEKHIKDLLCVSRNDWNDIFTFWSYYPNSGFTLNPSMISNDTFVISNMWNGKILNCELLVCHASFLFCCYHVIFQFSRITCVILKENSRVKIAWHF